MKNSGQIISKTVPIVHKLFCSFLSQSFPFAFSTRLLLVLLLCGSEEVFQNTP